MVVMVMIDEGTYLYIMEYCTYSTYLSRYLWPILAIHVMYEYSII